MTTVILVSILAAVAAGVLFLAARRGLPRLVIDARGIALQTVIVIVVMLAIAGAVAGVLLSTGSQVTSELASADLSGEISTQAECLAYRVGGTAGVWVVGPPSTCTWTNETMTDSECAFVKGAYTNNAAGTADTCVLTVT